MTTKRRSSGIPIKTNSRPERAERVFSEQIPRVRDYRELKDGRERRNSIGNASAILRGMEEDESGSIDSSMGFRELEKVSLGNAKN